MKKNVNRTCTFFIYIIFSFLTFALIIGCTRTSNSKNINTNKMNIIKADLPVDAVSRVEQYFESKKSARYMERNCEDAVYPGWEGFPLQKCRYNVKDKDGTIKNAEVIMLNASPNQLARWVVYTCIEIKGSAAPEFTEKLSKHIIMQSGAQYPVAGMVYEDMEGDGIYKLYCFRDGVTVGIKGIESASKKVMNEDEINQCLYGEVEWCGTYARIQSTTREQYTSFGGKEDVGTSTKGNKKISWMKVSRELYQAAWGSDRNELMLAWAKQNL